MVKLHDWNKCRLMVHTTAHTLEKLAKDKYDTNISVSYSARELSDVYGHGFTFIIRDCAGEYFCSLSTARIKAIKEMQFELDALVRRFVDEVL